jgi:hypothetical protein
MAALADDVDERTSFLVPDRSQGELKMQRESIRRHHRAATIVISLLFMAGPAITQANDWADDEPAEATSGQMEDHEASSKDPDEMTVGSHDPDEMTVESETMDGRMAESEDPDRMVVGSEEMSQHMGSSTDLTDLKQARPDEGFEAIEVPGQSEWETTTDPSVLVARKHLVRAQQRARNARTVYGDMMENNYPRGAARIQIVKERDASMEALREAKSALEAAEG